LRQAGAVRSTGFDFEVAIMSKKPARALGLCAASFLLLSSALPLAAQETGTAVYYSDWFQGRPMANGEIFDQANLTASHKTYPFGSMVKVTNLANDKSVVVRVTDRMATRSKMLISVTRSAAEQLGYLEDGTAQVRLEVVERGDGKRSRAYDNADAGGAAKPSPVRN
jgi:rare lipoprotein A